MTRTRVVRTIELSLGLFTAIAAMSGLSAKEAPDRCDPVTHGAIPDDGELDMEAIQTAIDACGGTGGTVHLGAGEWHTGLLILHPAMEFKLGAGAVLTLVPDMALYPEQTRVLPDGEVRTFHTAIHAPEARDLTISGPGRIEGNGEKFWDEDFYSLNIPRSTLPRPAPLLAITDCSDVMISGIRMDNTPAYALAVNRCENVRMLDITITNDARSPNTDGIQIRDSSDVFITRASIKTGDDGIVLKSRRDVIDNLVVTDSIIESDDAAIKFGTRSEVGVRNSLFSDIIIRNSRYGVAIFQIDGGSHTDNRFHNILIETGGRHKRQFPIFIDMDRRESDDTWGGIERLTFSNIDIVTNGASLLAGNPQAPIRDLRLSNVSVALPNGEYDLSGSRKPRGSVTISEQQGSADYSREPAHFAFAHIDGLTMDRISVQADSGTSSRKLVFTHDVKMQPNAHAIPE